MNIKAVENLLIFIVRLTMFKFTVVAFCVLMGLVRAEHDSIEVDGTLNCEGECYSSGAVRFLMGLRENWIKNLRILSMFKYRVA